MFRGSIPASPKHFSFSMIFHLNEEVNNNYNNNNSSNSLVFGRWPQTKRSSILFCSMLTASSKHNGTIMPFKRPLADLKVEQKFHNIFPWKGNLIMAKNVVLALVVEGLTPKSKVRRSNAIIGLIKKYLSSVQWQQSVAKLLTALVKPSCSGDSVT